MPGRPRPPRVDTSSLCDRLLRPEAVQVARRLPPDLCCLTCKQVQIRLAAHDVMVRELAGGVRRLRPTLQCVGDTGRRATQDRLRPWASDHLHNTRTRLSSA